MITLRRLMFIGLWENSFFINSDYILEVYDYLDWFSDYPSRFYDYRATRDPFFLDSDYILEVYDYLVRIPYLGNALFWKPSP
jgi:hypothetical protein